MKANFFISCPLRRIFISVSFVFFSGCSSIVIDSDTRKQFLYKERVDPATATMCYPDPKTKTLSCFPVETKITTVIAEVTVAKSPHNDDCFLILNGRIDKDLASAFDKSIEELESMQCSRKIVVLSSPGGDVSTAMQIGSKIRSLQIDTLFDGARGKGNRCASSCTLLFIAGKNRIVTENTIGRFSSDMGFHQWSKSAEPNRDCTNPDTIRKLLNPYASRMLSVNSASKFIEMTINTECGLISNYSPAQLFEFGIATHTKIR
jgi:hypothetical protein